MISDPNFNVVPRFLFHLVTERNIEIKEQENGRLVYRTTQEQE